jgi:AcrR family transcriptional regulator
METADHRPRVAAERRERMRARLLEAALVLASGKGPEAVTIDAVIAQAQVARGSFYKYFDSPSALVQALGIEVSDALIRAMNPLVDPLTDSAERIMVGARCVLRLVHQYPALGKFMVRSGWPAMEGSHAFFTLVGGNLAQGIEAGRFAPMPLDVALSAVAGTLLGAMHAVTSHDVSADFAEQTSAAVLRALGLPASEAQTLSNAALAMPVIEQDSLVGRFMASPSPTDDTEI